VNRLELLVDQAALDQVWHRVVDVEKAFPKAEGVLPPAVPGALASLLPEADRDGTLQVAVFPHEEAHRIPVGLPDFKSGVGL